jgi:hypothetical protein
VNALNVEHPQKVLAAAASAYQRSSSMLELELARSGAHQYESALM